MSWTIAFLLAGCGGSPDDASTNQLSSPSSDAPDATDAPDQVVTRFYDAMRAGDDSAIASLLTDKARNETAKNGLQILSQGNSSLSYEIGKTEYITEEMDGAHVASLWTEPDEHKQPVTTEVIWVLRRQTNGWRVAGFAQVFDGELPLLFDFEDPEHMLRTKEYVETGLYGGQNEPPMQTADPQVPASTDTQLR
jgi:hypothetical protein